MQQKMAGFKLSTIGWIILIAALFKFIIHWHAWIEHQNGYEYLLCGEDYQGYSIVNLTSGKTNVYFPEDGHKGWGFC